MRFHRFIGQFDFFDHHLKIFDVEIIKQIRDVLRLKRGDRIILCDGKLNEILVKIADLKKDSINTKIVESRKNQNEPEKHVVLYCSLLKRESFEWVCQKATEVGVKEIVPIVSERTIKLNFKEERLKKIIKEAAEQSGRGIVPVLHEAVNFEKAVEAAREDEVNLFFDASGKACGKTYGSDILTGAKKIGMFIGPEGGWSEKELELARAAKNFKVVNLGKLTLRAETAAVAGAYLVCNL